MPVTNRKVIPKPATPEKKRRVAKRIDTRKKPSMPEPAVGGSVAPSRTEPVRAKLFQNGRSQAVRLPKEFRFEGKEVQVSRQGDSILLTPVNTRSRQQYWDELFQKLDEFRDLDFPECEDDGVTEPEEIFPEGW